MANRIKFTAEKKDKFLAILRECANISHAAESIGMSRRYMYDVRENDSEFASAWDEAVEASLDDIEHALRKRAVEGFEKPVFYHGEVCGSVREYSDTAAIFLLKGRRPDVYRDRTDTSVTVRTLSEDLTDRLREAKGKAQQSRGQ